MEKFVLGNVSGCKWPIKKKKGVVVISHGMAEHIERYDDFATFLNNNGYEVWGVNHLGHGDAIGAGIKGHWPVNGFYKCVENLHKVVHEAKKEGHPVFLLGHSMGSFLSQEYIKIHGLEINGCILSGTDKFSKRLANTALTLLSLLPMKNEAECGVMDKMSFGNYNKEFEPNRTKFDWLSRDNNQVDKYIADPLCGFVCTKGYYKGFMEGLSHLNEKLDLIRHDLPIFIVSGDKDPVGSDGKGPQNLHDKYKEIGLNDVSIKLYKDARHEILNEINKEEVYEDILNWINSRNI